MLQADAYDGYNRLYLADRKPGPTIEAACWSHGRRPFFVMADIEANARRKAVGKEEIPLSLIAIVSMQSRGEYVNFRRLQSPL